MNHKSHISVIGAGAWGTTVANLFAQNGFPVTIWAYSEATAAAIRDGRHPRLPGCEISSMKSTQSISDCLDGDYIVIALASKQFSILDQIDSKALTGKPILILTKGLNQDGDELFISDAIAARFQTDQIAVLSGPNLALEIAQKKPAATVVASANSELASFFQSTLTRPYFRVYTQSDMKGVECVGILKNVMAIASGISDGLDLGQNAKAALLSRGLIEMNKVAQGFGASSATVFGLSGLADLMVTAHSDLSRNWTFGYQWVTGKADDTKVVEGLKTVQRIKPKIDELGWDLPIIDGVYHILINGVDPRSVVDTFFSRNQKSEIGDL